MKANRLYVLAAISGLLAMWQALPAQNWSPPVAVTSGAGDDHHIDVAQNWENYIGWLAWDRTTAGNTDIYVRTINFTTGELGDEIQLTSTPSIDEKPSLVYGLWDNGVVYQSDLSGPFGIYYVRQTHEGAFLEPWLSLTSTEDLYDPTYTLKMSDIFVPCLFFHSDSSAQYFDTFDPWWEIPINQTFNVIVSNDYPVAVSQGCFQPGDVVIPPAIRWVWEYSADGLSKVGYSCFILTWMWFGTWYEGTVPQMENWNYDHPRIENETIYLERLADSDCDIVCTTLDTSLGGFPIPQNVFEDMGNERSPDVLWGSLVFETDLNGNWDIAYWNAGFETPEFVDTDPAEDRNPVIVSASGQLHAFWESNRDGSWKIYYSQRDVVGVEPEPSMPLPKSFDVSVHPNPGNARFAITLELPTPGLVKAGIYDLSGRFIKRIFNGNLTAGEHSFTWEAAPKPSGIYLLQVQDGSTSKIEKIVLLK